MLCNESVDQGQAKPTPLKIQYGDGSVQMGHIIFNISIMSTEVSVGNLE
jgi:hypothetical protein